jgi:NADPH2:quinone reductase
MKLERMELNAVRVAAKADSADALQPRIEAVAPPPLQPGQALVRVKSAGVNPSDVKAALGLMPQAVWPRSPGRDYAGVVVDGPAEWVGREVWGSGGDLGITRDGTHAGWLLLPVEALREKPRALDFDAAGSVGVPFVTAYEGWRRAGLPQRGQVVVVFGANGKVGQAAVQLAAMAGATVVAVQRCATLQGHAATAVEVVDAREGEVAERVRAAAGGRGADLVFNTVGSAYFEAANRVMAKGATQVFIATTDRAVPFDIFAFYRGMHTYVGIDTLAFDCVASNERLDAMRNGFDSGALQPFPVREGSVYGLERAAEAYRRVIGGDAERIVLRP